MKTEVGDWEMVVLASHGDGWLAHRPTRVSMTPATPAAPASLELEIPRSLVMTLRVNPQPLCFGLRRKGDDGPSIVAVSPLVVLALLALYELMKGSLKGVLCIDITNKVILPMVDDGVNRRPMPHGPIVWSHVVEDATLSAVTTWVARAALILDFTVELKV